MQRSVLQGICSQQAGHGNRKLIRVTKPAMEDRPPLQIWETPLRRFREVRSFYPQIGGDLGPENPGTHVA
jgi:hypothetical protein